VRLVRGGQTVSSVARTLGLSDQTLHNWLKAEAAGGVARDNGQGGQRRAHGDRSAKGDAKRGQVQSDIARSA
jgi:transposase-like protein